MGFDTGVTPYTTEDHFRANYYEALDTVIGCISDRFKHEGSCDIMDLKYVFIQCIAENDLSLKAFVTGISSNNFTSLTTWDNNCFSRIDIRTFYYSNSIMYAGSFLRGIVGMK